MTPENAYRDLADRVEGATGPDRGLDCAIADAVGAWPEGWVKHLPGMGAPFAYHNPNGGAEWMEAPAYTSSIDEALTLVPLRTDDGNYTWAAGDCHENEYDSWACITEPPERSADFTAHAATPALTAAALRAHAARIGRVG